MIETPRLCLRKIAPSDFADLLKIYQVRENMQFILSGRADYRMEELQQKWAKMAWSDQRQYGFLIVERKEGKRIIGEAGFLRFPSTPDQELELAFLIDQSFWGQGYGTEICKALIAYGFEVLKMQRLKAGMYRDNQRSAQLVQKLGFRLRTEGTTTEGLHFQDHILWRSENQQGG